MNLTVDVQIASEDDDHPPPAKIEQWVAAAIVAAGTGVAADWGPLPFGRSDDLLQV